MKRIVSILLIAALLVPLAACGGGSVDTDRLVIWHDKEDAVVEALSAYLAEAAPEVEVVFEKKTSLTDSLKLVGNDPASAPDMFIFAHDKIGVFAEMGILADVNTLLPEGALDGWLPMTTEAATYKGTLYQLPLYFETLLFMYNRRYMQDDQVPATTEELYAYMEANTGRGRYGFVEQHSTAYYSGGLDTRLRRLHHLGGRHALPGPRGGQGRAALSPQVRGPHAGRDGVFHGEHPVPGGQGGLDHRRALDGAQRA